jgi:hypothetical protein
MMVAHLAYREWHRLSTGGFDYGRFYVRRIGTHDVLG